MSKKSRKQVKRNQQRSFDPRLVAAVVAAVVIVAVAAFVLLTQDDTESSDTVAQADLPSEISVSRAAELREEGAFILDVRQPEEWDEFHVPDSTLIPLGELASRVSEVPTDQEIVVVCRSGNRSQQGRDILTAAGFTNVTSMAGGLTEWRSRGYPVE